MGVAVLAAARGDAETAATLTGASGAAYADVAAHLLAPDASLAEPFLSRARRSLGESEWVAAVEGGGALLMDEAAEIAMGHAGE
jgi:DNA-binding IscR family transcriptional regulator